jgi:hypothetical protein
MACREGGGPLERVRKIVCTGRGLVVLRLLREATIVAGGPDAVTVEAVVVAVEAVVVAVEAVVIATAFLPSAGAPVSPLMTLWMRWRNIYMEGVGSC